MNLELISIPSIAFVVYWIINLLKYTFNNSEKLKRFIPIVSAILGAVLGIICFYALPNIIPANHILMALVIGGASGLTATGSHQIIKQLEKDSTK